MRIALHSHAPGLGRRRPNLAIALMPAAAGMLDG
jgi:hypothetical protein